MTRRLFLTASAAVLLACLAGRPGAAESFNVAAAGAAGGLDMRVARPNGGGLGWAEDVRWTRPRPRPPQHPVRHAPVTPVSASPAPSSQAAKPVPAAEAAASQRRGRELEDLRKSLTSKLGALNTRPAVQPGPAAAPAAAAAAMAPALPAAPPAPRPSCQATFDMAGWNAAGDFSAGLVERRRAVVSGAGAADAAPLARLAEFYLANGLAGEALDVTEEASGAPPPEAARLRLDADLARLMGGMPVDAGSPLLNNPADCDRPDLGLWRALAAAAAHDPAGVAGNIQAARDALRRLPEPVLHRLAFRLADAAADDLRTLLPLADLLRNSTEYLPEDLAAHLLLQARIARAQGNQADETSLLQHAARVDRSLPGLRARERLAELASSRDAPDAVQGEATLADIARVYRDDALGQSAAAYLAERKLCHGDFQAALAVADDSARSDGKHRMDSRGAALVARILRILLVEPAAGTLPDPAQRIALYLRYQGYATPGEKGDDIRLAAAQTLLTQGMPATALDVAHQLSEQVAATPPAGLTLALAETRAGDVSVALRLLQNLPPNDATHRATAEALARLQRPIEAAHQLDGLPAIADQAQRAALLCDGKAWNDAAAAYAALLRDPGLDDASRHELLDRYSLTLALTGDRDALRPAAAQGLAARVFAALPTADAAAGPGGRATVTAVRGALIRSKAVESLLSATPANQGS